MGCGGFSEARLRRMGETMARHVEQGGVPGLVALLHRRGETHVEAHGVKTLGEAEPMTRDTIFRIASMTKPVTAVAALILVEECVLRLDEPVDAFLPELANRRVLARLEAPLDDTVPARRPITLRDLLTFRAGYGFIMAPPGRYPIQKAIAEAGLAPGPRTPTFTPDEWLRGLAALPLIHQPGEQWLYHTAADVLGVLIARASGRTFEAFLRERIFEPLGMNDTGFSVPAAKLARLPSAYTRNPASGALELFDGASDTRFARRPAFPSGGGGLVSTADDYLAFCRMLLDRGAHRRGRILSRPSVELMTTDQLSAEQRAGAQLFLGDDRGWGFGGSVVIQRRGLASLGLYGWDGGYGTSGYSDAREDLVGILLTQRMMDSPVPPRVYQDFWTSAYQALND
jgi:CubicO group peptidase (beta-lactamase class C family)